MRYDVISWCPEFQKGAVDKTVVVVTTYLVYSVQWNFSIFLLFHALNFSSSLQRRNILKMRWQVYFSSDFVPGVTIIRTFLVFLREGLQISSFKWKNSCWECSWVYSESLCMGQNDNELNIKLRALKIKIKLQVCNALYAVGKSWPC